MFVNTYAQVQCRPSRIGSKLQEAEWGTTLICPFNTYSTVVVVWLGAAGVDRVRVYVYHACIDAYRVLSLDIICLYCSRHSSSSKSSFLNDIICAYLRKAYEFAKTQGFIPYDTCMPYLACSADSDEGFCKHVDTSCVNICRTCSTFASFGGTCSEVNDALLLQYLFLVELSQFHGLIHPFTTFAVLSIQQYIFLVKD